MGERQSAAPMNDPVKAENERTCRYGTHAPRDCPARVYALSGTTPPACPVPTADDAEFYRLREQHQSGNHDECPPAWCLDVRPGGTDLLAALGRAVDAARADRLSRPAQPTTGGTP